MWFLGDIGAIPPELGSLQEVYGYRYHSSVGQRRKYGRSKCRGVGQSFHLLA